MSWMQGVRARFTLMFARRVTESRMEKEFRFHIEMETERIVRELGVPKPEARRRALVAFGGLEKHREDLRDGRGLRWLGGLALDLRLGLRMLRKYPGLTLVGSLAMSVAIAAGASYLEVLNDVFRSSLPVEDGDRVVMIQNWDVGARKRSPHILHDYAGWRTQVSSIQDFGAFHKFERTLVTTDGRGEPVRGTEVSAAAFRVMHAKAFLGRTLLDDDELPNASTVAVIGHGLWLTRFGGDSAIVGKTIQLGRTRYAVVGVMPAGFSFPDGMSLWVPLVLTPSEFARGTGPDIKVFGRLAPGVRIETVQAELNAIGQRAAADFPTTNKNVRPIVRPFMDWIVSPAGEDVVAMQLAYFANIFFLGLLAVCASNVATLVFARTASRSAELSVRTALGASRARLVSQLFAEALVLTTLATAIALLATYYGLRTLTHRVFDAASGMLPFWWNDRLSAPTLVYALLLAVLGALVVGVVPALKATGTNLLVQLKHAGASGSVMKFGRLWTSVIVSQVALTVAFLFLVASLAWNARVGRYLPGKFTLPAEQYLSANLTVDADPLPDGKPMPLPEEMRIQLNATYERLKLQLLAEPNVVGVTYASRLPGVELDRLRIELDTTAGVQLPNVSQSVRIASVDPEFFHTTNTRIIAGRDFDRGDVEKGRYVAIVDSSFAQRLIGNHNAIGQRFREARDGADDTPGAWIEIVGVVADLMSVPDKSVEDVAVYRAASPSAAYPMGLAVHVKGAPESFTQQLRVTAAKVDPTLRVTDVEPLVNIDRGWRWFFGYMSRALVLFGAVAVLLSAAGVYSLMAFTVARRTREIGIRVALGASARIVVAEIFSPALRQVALGIALGSVPGLAFVAFGAPEVARGAGFVVALATFFVVGLFIMLVGLIACFVPARRALRIQPTVALKDAG